MLIDAQKSLHFELLSSQFQFCLDHYKNMLFIISGFVMAPIDAIKLHH